MLRTQHLRRLRAVEGGDVRGGKQRGGGAGGCGVDGAGIGERNRTLEDSI